MVTVERVLPWRRDKRQTEDQIAPLVVRFDGPDRESKIDAISRAYRMADKAHQTQVRKSGEPYMVHPLAVARIVADLGLDDVTIVAALLHDAVEDTKITVEDIRRAFGSEVSAIVDGVTKLDRLKFNTKEEQQAATHRKMLVAMAKDVRVLIIKLCDRLHNLRTLAALPEWKQERIARETLDVYAPLAHRLGMQDIKTQLEDLSFAALHPKRYAEIEYMVTARAPERELYLTQVVEQIQAAIAKAEIDAACKSRDKHLYSIYEKMVVKNREFEGINDLMGVRVIVKGFRECYAVLGVIHREWQPLPGRFKDYVAMPKFNLYQSLHTTVIGPGNKPVEIQIRTHDMHEWAETGIASHYAYKDGRRGRKKDGQKDGDDDGLKRVRDAKDLPLLGRIAELERETTEPGEFMDSLRVDLENDEVYVFAPDGKVVTLPAEATPVDFAYAIHTSVGHRCVGAKVDGRLVDLREHLNSGETVEIFVSKVDGAGPSYDWLRFVKSRRATNKIRQWFSKERQAEAIKEGRLELDAALRREGLTKDDIARLERGGQDDRKNGKGKSGKSNKGSKNGKGGTRFEPAGKTLETVAEQLDYPSIDALYAAIGEHNITAASVAARVVKSLRPPVEEESSPAARPLQAGARGRTDPGAVGVRVEGFDDVYVRLSKCCTPVPPDRIMGFITRGRGVSVHRIDCANGLSLRESHAERLIDVEWDSGQGTSYIVSLEVKAYDRTHLLSNVSQAFSEQSVNIVGCSTQTASDRIARLSFDFEIADPAHLDWVIRSIRQVDGVYDVYRVVAGQSR